MKSIFEFVYNELRIDSFIVPAVYLGWINSVVWVRQEMSSPLKTQMFVGSFNDAGGKFYTGMIKNSCLPVEITHFSYHKFSATEFNNFEPEMLGEQILLDIDLDFFSCCEDPFIQKEILIEITKEEYDEFIESKYHRLRLLVGYVRVIKKNRSYFYVLNYFEGKYPNTREVPYNIIEQRVEFFFEYLKMKKFRPQLITVCRSVYSGYIPSHQVDIIQRLVLGKLRELYDIEIQEIAQLS